MTRTGKIARLPAAIQEQVNHRLQNNQPSAALLAWLHRLPEVRSVLAAQFKARPITKQNLSRWRLGGFRDWQIWQQTRKPVPIPAAQTDPVPPGADPIVAALTARYYRAADACLAASDPDRNMKFIRICCSDLLKLQSCQIQIARLKINQRLLALRERATLPK